MKIRLIAGTVLFCLIGFGLSAVASGAEQHERSGHSGEARVHESAMAASVSTGPFVIDSSKSTGALLDESMAVMSRDMNHAAMTGDPDHDFAAMMIPHHQGAIDMAKVEILRGKNPVLRRLAQEIIVTQRSEIGVLQMQLDRVRIEGPTPGESAR